MFEQKDFDVMKNKHQAASAVQYSFGCRLDHIEKMF